MLIQIHILQNYAPANLNRDDTGSPKDAYFGGIRRGRISSQCLKRSFRRSEIFDKAFKSEGLLGVRTRSLPSLVEKALQELTSNEKAISDVVRRVREIGRESKKDKETDEEDISKTEADVETKQLIFISPSEVKPLAEKLLETYLAMGEITWNNPKTKIGDITDKLESIAPRSVDIAMFGRMTTSSAFEDVQAAVQVAHAISTNALTEEFDYFTAVDDLLGESGAGMIGDVEFNSSTYYKYLNVCWEDLVNNLGDDVSIASRAVQALVEAAVYAQPSGKQNSFAAFNLPDLVLVEISQRNIPVSYANAFLKPAKPSHDHTIMQVSINNLSDYLQKTLQKYTLPAQRAFVSLDEQTIPTCQSLRNMDELIHWLAQQLQESA